MTYLNEKNYRVLILFTFLCLAVLVLMSCIPKNMAPPITVQPMAEPDTLIQLTGKMVKEKITRLEVMLMLHDTSMTKHDMWKKLFSLYIHINNPEPNYPKAILLVDSLTQNKKRTKEQLYYLNWQHILKKYLSVLTAQDSLTSVIKKTNKKAKHLHYKERQKSRQIDSLSTQIIDSLIVIIHQQKNALEKLKQLDLNLERQRSKIK